ncbi:MAG: DNA helicase UvrD, partial [Chloroflexi bacterium]|nr:DNA helicase UvrD [Chloroflexota bacterium]
RFLMDIPRDLFVSPAQLEEQKPKPKQSAAWTPGARQGASARTRVATLNSGVEAVAPASKRPARGGGQTAPVFSTGDKVRHATFGEGIVTACKPSGGDFEVTVAFKDGAGVKRLLLGFAKLEKVE